MNGSNPVLRTTAADLILSRTQDELYTFFL